MNQEMTAPRFYGRCDRHFALGDCARAAACKFDNMAVRITGLAGHHDLFVTCTVIFGTRQETHEHPCAAKLQSPRRIVGRIQLHAADVIVGA